MRHGMRAAAAALLVTAAFVPEIGHAGTAAAPECSGQVVGETTASCSVTFQLPDDAVFASLVDTHAGFHAGLDVTGRVALKWTDQTGRIVVEYSCPAAGSSPVGVTEVTRALCDETVPMAEEFTPGTQTLVVTVVEVQGCPANGCTFHGRLALHDSGDLF
ncbi:MAG: hypothetical protein WDA27_01035 [Actinomycetota bacterium]